MTPGPDIEQLLRKAQAGDRAALVEILDATGQRVRPRIEGKLSPALRAVLDADDVMQVTYLEAVMRFKSFTGGGASGFLAWLSRLAENNLIDAVRSLEAAKRGDPRKKVASREESMTDLINVLGVTHTTPSRVAAKGEAASVIEVALRALPPDYERVIREFDLEGKPMAQVAQAMGKSEGAAYMLRARAHDRLKEILGSESKFFSIQG